MARAQGMYKFSGAYQQKQEALRQARIQERKSVSSLDALHQIASQLESQPGVEGIERTNVGYWYGVDYTGEEVKNPSGYGYTSTGRKRSEVDPLYKVNVREALNRFYAGDVSFFNIEKATKEDRFNIPEFHGTGTGDLELATSYQQRMEVEAAERAQAKQKSLAVSEIESAFKQSLEGTTNKYTKESLAYQQQKVRESGYSPESIDAYNKEMERWSKNEESKSVQREYNYIKSLEEAKKGLVTPSSIQGESTTARTAREYVEKLNREVTTAKFSEQAVNKYNAEIEKLNRNISAKSTQAEWNVLQPYIGSTDKYYRQQGTALKPVSLGEVQESLDKPFYAFKPKQAEAIERGQYKVDAAGGVTIYDPVTAQSKMPKYDPTKKAWQQDFVVITPKSKIDKSIGGQIYFEGTPSSYDPVRFSRPYEPDIGVNERKVSGEQYLTKPLKEYGESATAWLSRGVEYYNRNVLPKVDNIPVVATVARFYGGFLEGTANLPAGVGWTAVGTEYIARDMAKEKIAVIKSDKGIVEKISVMQPFSGFASPSVKGVVKHGVPAYVGIGEEFKISPAKTVGALTSMTILGEATGVAVRGLKTGTTKGISKAKATRAYTEGVSPVVAEFSRIPSDLKSDIYKPIIKTASERVGKYTQPQAYAIKLTDGLYQDSTGAWHSNPVFKIGYKEPIIPIEQFVETIGKKAESIPIKSIVKYTTDISSKVGGGISSFKSDAMSPLLSEARRVIPDLRVGVSSTKQIAKRGIRSYTKPRMTYEQIGEELYVIKELPPKLSLRSLKGSGKTEPISTPHESDLIFKPEPIKPKPEIRELVIPRQTIENVKLLENPPMPDYKEPTHIKQGESQTLPKTQAELQYEEWYNFILEDNARVTARHTSREIVKTGLLKEGLPEGEIIITTPTDRVIKVEKSGDIKTLDIDTMGEPRDIIANPIRKPKSTPVERSIKIGYIGDKNPFTDGFEPVPTHMSIKNLELTGFWESKSNLDQMRLISISDVNIEPMRKTPRVSTKSMSTKYKPPRVSSEKITSSGQILIHRQPIRTIDLSNLLKGESKLKPIDEFSVRGTQKTASEYYIGLPELVARERIRGTDRYALSIGVVPYSLIGKVSYRQQTPSRKVESVIKGNVSYVQHPISSTMTNQIVYTTNQVTSTQPIAISPVTIQSVITPQTEVVEQLQQQIIRQDEDTRQLLQLNFKPKSRNVALLLSTGRKPKTVKRKSKIGGFTWKITNPVPTFESLGFTPLKKTGKKSKKKIGGISL